MITILFGSKENLISGQKSSDIKFWRHSLRTGCVDLSGSGLMDAFCSRVASTLWPYRKD